MFYPLNQLNNLIRFFQQGNLRNSNQFQELSKFHQLIPKFSLNRFTQSMLVLKDLFYVLALLKLKNDLLLSHLLFQMKVQLFSYLSIPVTFLSALIFLFCSIFFLQILNYYLNGILKDLIVIFQIQFNFILFINLFLF